MNDKYETVIGLEVHVQLATKTKAFCGCSTVFGQEANTQVCPVCLGLPGVLPVFNKKAFEYSIKIALALDCEIQNIVKFDRKNYYYPDLPKNYQISQYDMPLAYKGKVIVDFEDGTTKLIGITRAHIEEDAGKLLHDPKAAFSYVDLNRTGTPLLEIVSDPDMRSADEAHKYLTLLKHIIKYLEVSDCNMEEGSFRCDANISLRKRGNSEFGVKVEIKNLNSFKAVRDALIFEQKRQQEKLDSAEPIIQETRLWDEKKNKTISMRSKEEAHDYRYFPEPDLVPFEINPDDVESLRASLPELPRAKALRFKNEYDLADSDIEVLIAEKDTAEFFEEVVKYSVAPEIACNWIKGEVMRHIKEQGRDIKGLKVSPCDFAELINMVGEGKISGLSAKDVLEAHIKTGKGPAEIVKEKGLEQVSDEGELGKIILDVILSNEKSVNDYKLGKANALSFLIGQVMKKTKGKANPKLAGNMLRKELNGE
ncbi:MAG: Asp-tRNA(Asn)/Glu-tRNA(Gln) amidotransferase subunit GatB [Candidatus Omnitrophota bacterium]